MEDIPVLSNEEVSEIVRQYVKSSNFQVLAYRIGPLSDDIVGFLGEHLRLDVSVVANKSGVEEELNIHFFVKILPRNSFHSNYVVSMGAFEKEVLFYSTLLKDLSKYQKHNSALCLEDATGDNFWAPECFLTRPDLIVLEDLSGINFNTLDIREPMDFQHCSVAIRTLARFHASSIIFEEKETKASGKICRINELYPKLFEENLFVDSDDKLAKGWFLTSIKAMVALTELLPKYGKGHEKHQLIKEKIPEVCMRIKDLVKSSGKHRNVVCEGDLWTNNILFRCCDGEMPVEARIVDFQLVRYTPPAHDVIFFLHMATTRDFRKHHLEELLEVYYNSLSSELHRHDLDADVLLSWTEFRESCDLLRDVGRIIAPADHQLGVMKSDFIIPNVETEEKLNRFMVVNRNVVVCDSFRSDPVFRKWMTDDLEELIECCILSQNE
ncbi:uncharacterized protein [Anabrus simplex]|uniref:uncharacterized protein n=1 Tax=Anabrus simplex TaxID=316456 RepID=UPI0035A33709